MTRYTDADLETALATAWILGDSKMRSTLTAIADWIDTFLAEDAESKGRPLANHSMRTIQVPISITTARVEAIY